MTLQEFKSWFEGFTESMPGSAPNAKQWARIKARVKEIDGTAVSYSVFIERYWPPRYLQGVPYWQQPGWNTCQSFTTNVKDDGHAVFNSSQAMLALGKADYQAVA